MKVAVTFSGQPRFDKEIFINHQNRLLSDEFKIYNHFWWNSSHFNKSIMFHSTERFARNDLDQEFAIHYRPWKSKIEDYKDFDISFCKSHNYDIWAGSSQKHYDIFTPSCLYGQISQKYSVHESVAIAADNGAEFIIRVRPDVLIEKDLRKIHFQLPIDDNSIFIQSSMEGGHLYAGEFPNRPCDWFYCGSTAAMIKFTGCANQFLKIACKNGVRHTNELLTLTADYAGLKLIMLDFGALISKQVRKDSNHREISLYYDEFDSSNLKITHNHDFWPLWHEKVDFQFLRRQGI